MTTVRLPVELEQKLDTSSKVLHKSKTEMLIKNMDHKMTAKILLIMVTLIFSLNSCTYTYTQKIPGDFSPRQTEKKIWQDGVCYLTSELDSIHVKTGLLQDNDYTAILKIQIENKKTKRVFINPSNFYYIMLDSLMEDRWNARTNAENTESKIAMLNNHIATMAPPQRPSKSGIDVVIDILDIFSSDTPEKQKKQQEQEQERNREEIEYQSRMISYQQNLNTSLRRKQELENDYLKTNDVDPLKSVSGKVEFSSPFFYRAGSYVKLIFPIDGKEHSFIYNFKPNRYKTITD